MPINSPKKNALSPTFPNNTLKNSPLVLEITTQTKLLNFLNIKMTSIECPKSISPISGDESTPRKSWPKVSAPLELDSTTLQTSLQPGWTSFQLSGKDALTNMTSKNLNNKKENARRDLPQHHTTPFLAVIRYFRHWKWDKRKTECFQSTIGR